MIREVSADFIGQAGEYFVLGELSRQGWTAALPARNNRAFDILAKRGDVTAAIRVKTKSPLSDAFQWQAKKKTGNIFLDLSEHHDFCVLVDIPEQSGGGPIYYIVPTHTIECWLQEDFKKWLETPGAQGQQRAATNLRRIFHLDGRAEKIGCGYREKLAPYKGAWHLLDGPKGAQNGHD